MATVRVHTSTGKQRLSAPVTIFVGVRGFERSIVQFNDDAEELANGRMYLDSSDLDLIHGSYRGGKRYDQVVGMRFTDIRIPQGTRIKKAYLQFTVDEVSTGPTALTIHAELAGNAGPFTDVRHNISSRKRASATVKWSPEPWSVVGQRSEKQRTPDLSSLIQEVIAQPGWQEGNALVLIVTGSGKRCAESYDGDKDGAPMLYVEY